MKKTVKTALLMAAAVLTVALAACGGKEPAADTVTVTVAIDCTTAYQGGYDLAAQVSDEGIILSEVQLQVEEGTTADQVITRAARENNIPLVATGEGEMWYITHINSIGSGDCGDMSGWLYIVNGEMPMEGAAMYEVQEGDSIALRYSLDYGLDLGFSW